MSCVNNRPCRKDLIFAAPHHLYAKLLEANQAERHAALLVGDALTRNQAQSWRIAVKLSICNVVSFARLLCATHPRTAADHRCFMLQQLLSDMT